MLALACVGIVGLPVLSIFASFLGAAESADTLRHLLSTVIPAAMAETFLLGAGVVAGVVIVGSVTAWLAATCEFPGRRVLEWALLLPLAMPAYIVAYAYTDALQFAGPLQTALRDGVRLAPGRLLVPGDPLHSGRDLRVHRRAVSLCLSAGPHGLSSRARRP